jgi:hypothetical protein
MPGGITGLPSPWVMSFNTKTLKYDHESLDTQAQERFPWRGPATTENYKPELSSEKAPHINKPVTNCLKIK